MKVHGSYAGFKYCIKPKPLFGAYVAMETFGRGLLEHGTFDEYHTYYDQRFLRTLPKDELIRAYFKFDKLKIMRLSNPVRNPEVSYPFLHFEVCQPTREVVFRNLFSRRNIPVTRRVYAIPTNDHLREFLDICILNDGGRPYDSIVVPSRATRDAVLAYFADVTQFTKGRLHYRGRVDVIPHGIDIQQFQPRNQRRAREAFGIPHHAIVLLSLARISSSSKMNFARLLQFFKQVTQRTGDDLLLVLAGGDQENESQHLQQQARELGIADRIKFITNFTDECKARILACADIFLSLSDNLQESFGISLVEAMAMQLPVLCTDWSGYKEIVDEGLTGYRIPTLWKPNRSPEDVLINLTDPYSPSAVARVSREIHVDTDLLVSRALELIHDEALRRRMGQNGRNKVEKNYLVKTEVLRFEALWHELAEMARTDTREYGDLSPLLSHDYPRHFRAYPTYLENTAPEMTPAEIIPEVMRQRPGAMT